MEKTGIELLKDNIQYEMKSWRAVTEDDHILKERISKIIDRDCSPSPSIAMGFEKEYKVVKEVIDSDGKEVWYTDGTICVIIILDKDNNLLDIDNGTSGMVVSNKYLHEMARKYLKTLKKKE